ncbi:MAG: aspartyl protease family protein [Terracidiphilus sp.]
MIGRILSRRFLTFIFLLASVCVPAFAANEPDLCETHDWFQLRESIARNPSSQLCKGAVDASFEKRAEAEKELQAVIRKIPHSSSSYRAHELLMMMYFRQGRYRKAAAQLDRMLAEKPDAEDAKAVQSLLAVLARNPDMTIVSNSPSMLRSETIERSLFVPVTANGVAGSYIVDSGANISIMSESEARRLGLKLEATSTQASDVSGVGTAIRAAVVTDLWIGKTHLKHVGFIVSSDAGMPFVDLPEGYKGVLGIPVLIALKSLRIGKENQVDIGVGPASASAKLVPLAFDGALPVTQMSTNGKKFNFSLDTGADPTYLGPIFAEAFPELMQTGVKKDRTLKGISGNTIQESIVVPSVRFSLGKEVELTPAIVLLKGSVPGSDWAAGNLGLDLISQTIPITIDFGAMQLSIEDR